MHPPCSRSNESRATPYSAIGAFFSKKVAGLRLLPVAMLWWLAMAHGFARLNEGRAPRPRSRGAGVQLRTGVPPGTETLRALPFSPFLPAASHAGDYRRARSRNGPHTVGTGRRCRGHEAAAPPVQCAGNGSATPAPRGRVASPKSQPSRLALDKAVRESRADAPDAAHTRGETHKGRLSPILRVSQPRWMAGRQSTELPVRRLAAKSC